MTRWSQLRSALALLLAAQFCCAASITLAAGFAIAQATAGQPASAQAAPGPPVIPPTGLEAGINGTVHDFMKSRRFEYLPESEVRDRVEFIAGNLIFATLHEVGHMLIAEMGLPVLGREEDAADSFATLIFLRVGTGFSHRLLAQAAGGWFLSERRDQKQKVKLNFFDQHGLDRQRAYNIVCLMVGSDSEKFDDELADIVKMPRERQETCQDDYSNASWSWNKALAPHRRQPGQPKTNIGVSYADSPAYQIYADGFRKIRLLETIADILSDRFVWRGPIELGMLSCGMPNAHWDLSARRIDICYELAADFAEMYRGYAGRPAGTSSVPAQPLDIGVLASFRAAPE
jgi:hypothetical protein